MTEARLVCELGIALGVDNQEPRESGLSLGGISQDMYHSTNKLRTYNVNVEWSHFPNKINNNFFKKILLIMVRCHKDVSVSRKTPVLQ